MIERGRSKTTSQAQNNRGRSRSKSKPRYKDLECHFCVKTGHVKRCYKWKKENHTSNGKHEKKDNDANSNRINTTSSDDLLVVYDENLINLAYNETNWVVDSGASFHVTFGRQFFSSYTSSDFGVVMLRNDGLTKVACTRTVCLEINMGSKFILKEVRHVHDIRLSPLAN